MVLEGEMADTCFGRTHPLGAGERTTPNRRFAGRAGASMSVRRRGQAEPPRRAAGDEGTAILEFTLVAVLLFTLIFGIINFGLILSFKQDMTRAAAEGARAGAVALPSTTVGASDSRRLAAQTATEEAVTELGRTCSGSDGMTCAVQIHDCDFTPAEGNVSPSPDSNGYDNNAQPDCITVRLVYDHDAHPLLAKLPMIAPVLPKSLKASSVVRLNE
jgi:Flp pilus assembly protein TadG